MKKDERHRKMHVTRVDSENAKRARLRYRVIERLAGERSLLEVTLETGRKHQIRVQLSTRRWPIVGDRKYGSQSFHADGVALHAISLGFLHPVSREPLQFTAPLPASWNEFAIQTAPPAGK